MNLYGRPARKAFLAVTRDIANELASEATTFWRLRLRPFHQPINRLLQRCFHVN